MDKLNPRLVNAPIVIVDDDHDDQFLIQRILDRLGITVPVHFFDNGKSAIDYLTATTDETFIIFSDINMPIMNGLELRDRINKNEYLRRKSIPFVYYSTAARPADVTAAYDMTVQGFFIKEADLQSMEDAIELIFLYWTKCKHPNSVRKDHSLR